MEQPIFVYTLLKMYIYYKNKSPNSTAIGCYLAAVEQTTQRV